jgi:hypothetical protein
MVQYLVPKDGKLLLRKAMERYIPNLVTEREKQGFSAPDVSYADVVPFVINDDKRFFLKYIPVEK